ncbi:NAD-dependent DNA ligase, adenylation [uncultured Caudovirales phage]|uniref:NAD-dependent DNA ligase, adenylation n=1 Tax=uncultured Caudovirales phage TaxID=2100421 RepID=A0A6J5NEK7_9CAUD|nr:NAD-dependent DNA ligase, adenylation [uncultured Caudovirales phage]
MTELAALNVRITGDSGDLTAAVNSAKTQLGGLNTTIAQTQAKAAGMGGALGGLATRFSGARGQIQNVAFQLQDMAVQLGAGTAASVVFAQQGSQIASAFGPVGAVVGALAAVGIPLLALAFSGASAEAEALSKAAEGQAKSLDALTQATYNLRLERQMMQSGAQFIEEQQQLNEINRLEKERADVIARINQLQSVGGRAAGYKAEADAKREVLQSELDGIQAKINALNYQRQLGVEERRRANERRNDYREEKASQDALQSSMVTAYSLYARTRMEAAGLANETARAASAFGALQQSLADRGKVYSGRGGDPRTANQQGYGQFQYAGPQLDQFNNPIAAGGGGSAAANQLQTELQTLQESLMTQEQLQMESYTRQQEILRSALDQRMITQQEYQTLMEAASAQHFKAMADGSANGATQILGALGTLFEGNKKVGAGIALVNTMMGASVELQKGTFGIASAIRVIAQGMGFVRAIKSASSSGASSVGTGATSAAAAAPQQNVQTLNFTLTNDSFGIGQNLIRQIAAQLNESQRNGSTLIRATVS